MCFRHFGGLYDVLLPSWHYGVTVVAHRMRTCDAAHVCDLMARHRVRKAFLVPTTLKMMRHIEAPRHRYDVRVRTIFTGGDAVGGACTSGSRVAWGGRTRAVEKARWKRPFEFPILPEPASTRSGMTPRAADVSSTLVCWY